MKISFHGAARTVTGSKHVVHLNSGKKILLDCGMFQGMGRDTPKLNADWGFDPTEITYVIISHAHIDHSGLLPRLVKDGFDGKIFCTTPTESLLKLMLVDSAHIQEADVRYVNKERTRQGKEPVAPLYDQADAYNVFPLLHTLGYNEPHKIDDDIELLFTDCGHILGSAAVNLKLKEHDKEVRLTFSGDLGRYRDVILRSPEPFPQADFIILESTYGNKLHDLYTGSADLLLQHIQHTCVEKKGKLIIPAFSIGRTQELLYALNRLDLERRLPKLKYYVDSPLSIKATEVIKQHPECFNRNVRKMLEKDEDVFSFSGLQYIESVDESISLNHSTEPCVIISASGMADAGRVKHHIAHAISHPEHTILIVGYCEPNSLGGRLKKRPDHVSIIGRRFDVKAEVATIDTLSAHGDYEDMSQWLSCQDPGQVRKLFLVHGEYDVQVQFRERLVKKGFMDVEIPAQHQEIGLGEL